MTRILVLLIALLSCSAGLASGSWLQIIKSEKGFLFVGPQPEEKFSFDVVGSTIRTADDHGRIFAQVDETIVQVMLYPLAELPKGDPLAQHRKYETDYLKKAGASITPSHRCAKLALPHEEWVATMPGLSTTTFVTVRTRRSVLIVGVAREQSGSVVAANKKLDSICASLKMR